MCADFRPVRSPRFSPLCVNLFQTQFLFAKQIRKASEIFSTENPIKRFSDNLLIHLVCFSKALPSLYRHWNSSNFHFINLKCFCKHQSFSVTFAVVRLIHGIIHNVWVDSSEQRNLNFSNKHEKTKSQDWFWDSSATRKYAASPATSFSSFSSPYRRSDYGNSFTSASSKYSSRTRFFPWVNCLLKLYLKKQWKSNKSNVICELHVQHYANLPRIRTKVFRFKSWQKPILNQPSHWLIHLENDHQKSNLFFKKQTLQLVQETPVVCTSNCPSIQFRQELTFNFKSMTSPCGTAKRLIV